MSQRFTRTDLLGRDVHWLVEVTFGGRTVRMSTADLVVDSDAGELVFDGCIDEVRFSEAVELLGDASGTATLPLECVWPVDVPALIAQGHALGGARAEVSRWIEETAYEARRKVLVGRIADPEYGSAEEPVNCSIEENAWEDQAIIPGPSLVVNGANWPHADSLQVQHLGLAYPIVIGRPGAVRTSLYATGWISGQQPVWVDHRAVVVGSGNYGLTLVLAGHHVSAERVYLCTDAYPQGHRFIVRNGYDYMGQPIAYVPWYGTATNPPADVHEYDATADPYVFSVTDFDAALSYGLGHGSIDSSFQASDQAMVYAGWFDAESTAQGGLMWNGRLVRDAGDVLEYLLSLTTMRIDRGRFAIARPFLASFKIDCTIDKGTRPWDWVRQHLLSILPVSIVSGPDGLYPVVWRYDATEADAVCHLDTGTDPGLQRSGRIVTDTSKILNDFTLDFARDLRKQRFAGRVRLGAEPYDAADPNTRPSRHCRLSQQRHRTGDGRPLIAMDLASTIVVHDQTTAELVLAWKARAFALARRTVAYVGAEAEYGWLQPGAVLTITDAELHLDRQVCVLQDLQSDDSGTVGLVLLIIEDPTRDRRA